MEGFALGCLLEILGGANRATRLLAKKKKKNLCKITGVYEIMIGVAGRRQMMAINW